MDEKQFKELMEKLEEIRCGIIDIETVIEDLSDSNDNTNYPLSCGNENAKILRKIKFFLNDRRKNHGKTRAKAQANKSKNVVQ